MEYLRVDVLTWKTGTRPPEQRAGKGLPSPPTETTLYYLPVLSPLKRLIIISASTGAGAVLALALLGGGFIWYSSRPERPRPWNSKAIVATFDYPDVEGDAKTIVLYYTLQNTTDADYRLPKKDQLEITDRLRRENSLSAGGAAISIDEDENFLPPKQRRRFAIHLGYPMKAELGPAQTKEDQRRQWQVIANFIKQNFPNLNGFVVFDPMSRYQIEFPNGWDNIDLK